jgi:PKD repeat protein
MTYSCCPANANFTYTSGTSCNYTFTASGPATFCSGWIIKDLSNNPIGSGAGTTLNFTFPSSGTYIVCYSACALGNAGIPCRKETCQTITVACPSPCSNMDADFSYTISGCTVNFNDLTPEGNPDGCEYWTFGNTTVFAGDVTSYNFPGSGTYTVCHTDCCLNSADGQTYYHTVCKQITVNCSPPCCLPTNWTRTISNCCVSFAPVWGNGVCAFTNFFWNFGDGNVSNLSNPVHCYNGSGIYTVTLTAWCSKFQKITITKTIKVKCALPPPPPCCTGTSKIAFSTNGLLFSAFDASTYYADVTPTSYEWDWGDGTTSTGADAVHYYANPGTYTLSHTVQFSSSTGTSMSHTATQLITVNLSPQSTTTLQDPLVFASSPVQCSSGGHSTTLHVVDLEGRAGMTYQWMQSSSPSGPFTDMPGKVGAQCWVENITAPTYFRCRAICDAIAAFGFSDVIEMSNAQMDASISASPPDICVGGSSTLSVSAPAADAFEWFPIFNSGSSATVSPLVTTTYEVLATNNEGCGALATSTVTLNPCVIPPNDSPANATSVAYSSNMNYPNCYPLTGDHSFGSDSPESAGSAGPDSWYRFVAQSTAVSITLNSPSADDMIELYQQSGSVYTLMPGGSENASSGASDFERLNYQGLTPGTTYYISAGVASGSGGAFTLCIQHLMPSGCVSVAPPGGFSLCSSFKARYRGSSAQNVTYDFNFTGVGGGAPAVTTGLSGTNGIVSLSSPALQLRYGGVYDVQVDVLYSLTNSIGTTEQILINGSSTSSFCSGVTIMAQPQIEVRDIQRCPAVLLRSNFLTGRPVPGQVWPCGVVSYTYEFTQVAACNDGTLISFAPTEYTTASATPFLPLGVLPSLSNNGAWRVRIRPNFAYGEGTYGPPHTISVAQTSAMAEYSEQPEMQQKVDIKEIGDVHIYPNPNRGDQVNIALFLGQESMADLAITDESGRMVWSGQLTGSKEMLYLIEFDTPLSAGVYIVNIQAGEESFIRKLIVQ